MGNREMAFMPPVWRAPTEPQPVEPCFGLGCARRRSCRCYLAVELAPGGSTTRATCARNGCYPGYRAVSGEDCWE